MRRAAATSAKEPSRCTRPLSIQTARRAAKRRSGFSRALFCDAHERGFRRADREPLLTARDAPRRCDLREGTEPLYPAAFDPDGAPRRCDLCEGTEPLYPAVLDPDGAPRRQAPERFFTGAF